MESIGSIKNSKENIVTAHGGVLHDDDGNAYAVTTNSDLVPIPNSVAEIINISFKLQEKIDTGKYPHLAKLFHILNCRKTVFVAGGRMDVKDAVREHEKPADMAGYTELFEDVERLQHLGCVPVVDSFNDQNIEVMLDEYRGVFPAVVHVFEFTNGSQLENKVLDDLSENDTLDMSVVKKLHRIHSFVVLGTDLEGEKYLCFHKNGSGLVSNFEITDLKNVGNLYFAEEDRTDVTFIGPLFS